ncbi:MAG: hypothetical protein Q7S83_02970 [bacterium]|nr:hypothetical protein [bacterium]
MSIFTVAFVVFLIGYAIHYMKGEEPNATWCLVMMVCGAVMTLGNVLGLLMGSLISGLLLFMTVPMTVQYYRMWQIKKRGW